MTTSYTDLSGAKVVYLNDGHKLKQTYVSKIRIDANENIDGINKNFKYQHIYSGTLQFIFLLGTNKYRDVVMHE